MRLRPMISWLMAFVLLSAWGCTTTDKARPTTWVDLAEVNKSIDRSQKQSAVLDEARAAEEKPPPEARVKDLSGAVGGRNTYLQDLAGPKPKAFPKSSGEEGILLNFENADIYEVIRVMAETLALNYIIDPQVKGTVNIRSANKIPMDQLYDIFKKILHINGLDIRSEGKYEYIYVAKKLTSPLIHGAGDIGQLSDTPKLITQIVPVMHISSTEAGKLLEPYLSAQGTVYDLANLNTLIVTDFESKIVDALVLLNQLDVSPLSTLKVRLIKVENAPLFDLRDDLKEVLTALKINKKDFEGVSVTPLERVNSLLLMGSSDELLNTADKWIRELDVVPTSGRDNIYIYNVRNSVASELQELVSSLISEEGGGTTGKDKDKSLTTPAPATPKEKESSTSKSMSTKSKTSKTGKTAGEKKTKGAGAKGTAAALQFTGQPVLIADDTRNVILIRALQPDYARIQKLLERLDNLPRQVLIEVVVAEVSLTDSWQFGIEWTLKNQMNISHSPHTGLFGTNFKDLISPVSKDGPAAGLTLSILNSDNAVRALLNTVASDNHVNVLSSPHLLVLNNESASINVGQEVPILTQQNISPESTTTVNTNILQNIQYKDTGIMLTVTPRINYDGIIILEVEQQVSGVVTTTTSGINSPTINKREVKTKLAVKDGQPILMGGLIDTQKNNTENGVPGFKDIPLLGWLFKYQKEETVKRELILLITPYVIESEDVLDQYIREFNKKMTDLRGELNKISTMKHSVD